MSVVQGTAGVAAHAAPVAAARPGVRARAAAFAAALLLAGAVVVGAGVFSRPVHSVRVVGEFRHVSRPALQAALAGHLGGSLFSVDVDALRAAATTLPWVRGATVRRVWPDTLQVQVVERVAIARWNDSGLLEADGTRFAPGGGSLPAGLPRLRGPDGSARRVLDRLRTLREALGPLGGRLDRLALDERGAWHAGIAGGPELVLGRAPLDARMRASLGALGELLGSRLDEVERVDLRYAKGFAVRLRAAGSAKGGG